METNMKIKSTEYLQIDPMSEIFKDSREIDARKFLVGFRLMIKSMIHNKSIELIQKGWEVTDVKIKEDTSACGDPLFMLIFEIEREVK